MAIKPKYIKQLGNVLLEQYPDSFNTDFETNKESVTALTTVESKGVRNRIDRLRHARRRRRPPEAA